MSTSWTHEPGNQKCFVSVARASSCVVFLSLGEMPCGSLGRMWRGHQKNMVDTVPNQCIRRDSSMIICQVMQLATPMCPLIDLCAWKHEYCQAESNKRNGPLMTKQLNKFRLDKKLIFDQMKDFCRLSRRVSTLLMPLCSRTVLTNF